MFLILLFVPGGRWPVGVGTGAHRCGVTESRFTASDSQTRLANGQSTSFLNYNLGGLGKTNADVSGIETTGRELQWCTLEETVLGGQSPDTV